MSQRDSGYKRIERDCYETPEWVTRAVLPHLGNIKSVWEPAAGSGKMARALEAAGLQVLSTDISAGQDFLLAGEQPVDAIVTNPPYISATPFIEHEGACAKGDRRQGVVAKIVRGRIRRGDFGATDHQFQGSSFQFLERRSRKLYRPERRTRSAGAVHDGLYGG